MSAGELILYRSEDGRAEIQLRAEGDTVWLTQAEMADLFDTSVPNINIHIRNILKEEELDEGATIKDDLIVRDEGGRQVRRTVKFYSLPMILAVGYRVRSPRGTQFRQWATAHLEEYLVKGFVMDDERLKEPGGWDYFDELLARIRDIRASEKRFYQKVRDLFTLSSDYRPDDRDAQLFFDQIAESAVENDTLREAAQANTRDNFAYVFNRMLENLFIERMDGNEEIFGRLMNDDDFRRVAGEHLLHEVYERLQAG